MALTVKLDTRKQPDIVERRKGETTHAHWWTVPAGKERAAAIRSYVELVEGDQASRRAMDELHMRAYGAGNVAGEGLATAMRWQQRQQFRLRLNLIEQVCDAMQAKIAKLRPRPAVQTSQGEWGMRKKADALEQALDGEFYRNKIDDTSPRVALDGFIVGTGHWRVGRRGVGHPVIERVFPGEITVDTQDGIYGTPQSLFQQRLVDRERLIELFARGNEKLATEIRRIPASDPKSFPWLRNLRGHNDALWVIEAWHLPSGPKAKDGVHTICAGGAVEFLEPKQTVFTDSCFPLITYRWQARQFGYWGRGIAEEIMPQQLEMNYTLEKIQFMLHNASTVRHWVQGGGRIELNAKKMTNVPGEILTYYGASPPITDVVNAVPKELFAHIQTLKNDAFEAVGLSQFFATSSKPAGLDSGEAQRVYEDVGTERLILKGRAYENCHIEIAERVVDIKRAIAKDKDEDEAPVVVHTKRARGVTIRSLSFSDIDLEKDAYIMQLPPQSALPGTPSGRRATVAEWVQMGLITADEGRELLSFPDIKSANDEKFATRDSVLSAIEMMADDGQFVMPHPMLNVQEGKSLTMAAYTRLEWEGCPENNLELIARYFAALLALEQAATPPAPMSLPANQNAAPALPPGAAPGAMPPDLAQIGGPPAAIGAPPQLSAVGPAPAAA